MKSAALPSTTSLALFFSLLLASLAPHLHGGDWEALPPLPQPNGGFVCCTAEGRIAIVGGTNWNGGVKNWLKALHEYDPAARRWTHVRDLESPVAYGISIQNGSALQYLGGSDGKAPSRRLVVVNPVETIIAQGIELPPAVVLSAGGMVGESIVFTGGTDDAANIAGITRKTYEITREGVQERADYPGKPFAVAASAVVGHELFVFGGMNQDASTKEPLNSAEAFAFSPAKNEWRKLRSLPAATRGLSAVALDDRHIYLAGGYTSDFSAEALIYDVKSDSYAKARALPYAAMVGLVKLDGFVYCLGGEDKKQSRTDKFFRIPLSDLK
ncbi:Kelch repeat-containing protein [Prosthecobacter sp.]|uniref:Kelch repeat-containing protein n=1 Tax=Prosthecobacter sp. TaxID=1965333 RepID=UPI00378426C2